MKDQTNFSIDIKAIIVIVVLSLLIYYVLSYLELMRYIMMFVCSYKDFAENYQNLPNADGKNRVIISFTASKKDIDKLPAFIKSILDQTVKINQIALNIPSKKDYELDDELKNVVNVFVCGKDYKDANKIIPVLLREGESEAKILVLSPNYIYGKEFIETLVKVSNENPKNAIVTADKTAALVKPNFFKTESLDLIENVCNENSEDDLSWVINSVTVPVKILDYTKSIKNYF